MTTHTTRRCLILGAAATGALAALPAAAASGKQHKIEIRNFKFTPEKLKVKAGDTIRWTNRDQATHDATSIDKSWKTKKLRANKSAEITVTEGMTTDYFCSYHPSMKASLIIVTS